MPFPVEQGGEDYWLVAGLGNPGPGYCMSRHNVGFMVLDRLALDLGMTFETYGSLGLTSLGGLEGERFCLLKPLTYMNRSGKALGELKDRYEIPLARVMVVSDDFNLPLGRIRFRRQGGDGGHNGLKSIIRSLGTGLFPRLRVGVGPVPRGLGIVDHVLGDFDGEELECIQQVLPRAGEALRLWLDQGDIDLCMNRFNKDPERIT